MVVADIKCVIVGDGAVGKTQMLISYTTSKYPFRHMQTVFDNYLTTVTIDNEEYRLCLYDTAGQEDYDRLRPLSYPRTDIFLLCFSVTSPVSFMNIREKWFPEIHHHCPGVPFIIVGTQTDFREDPVVLKQLAKHKMTLVKKEDGERMAKEIGAVKYIECSATNQYKLKDAFDEATIAALSDPLSQLRHYRLYKSLSEPRDPPQQANSSRSVSEVIKISNLEPSVAFECPTCQNFSRSNVIENSSLLSSRHLGCPSCCLLFEGIARFMGRDFHEKFHHMYAYKTHLPTGESCTAFRPGELLVSLNTGIEFFMEQENLTAVPDIGWGRTISTDPLSAKCIALALTWLRDCVKEHGRFQCATYKESSLPARVLHVGSRYKDPHLHETKGEKGKYIALSYCWGDSLPLTTTCSTLKKRKKRIPYSSLPHTLRDAVLVARAFGISYLWVDALCIIQDSSTDWAMESSKMADIFAKALFVISADAATDCQSGFLRPRTGHSERKTLEIKCCGGIDSGKSIFVRRQGEKFSSAVAHSSDKSQSRLSTRGWAFQERYLANRTLIFASEEMAWECRSLTQCECKLAIRGSMTLDFLKDWNLAIETYSALQLTRKSDRLPAVSGIAAAYHGSSPEFDKYICGLWQARFAEQLLWYTSKAYGSQFTSRRHREYQAPSWSWASVTGPVTYYHHRFGHQDPANKLTVLATFSRPASSNPYSSVRAARTTVFGRLCPVQVCPGVAGDYSLLLFYGKHLSQLIPIPQDILDQNIPTTESHAGCEVNINVRGNYIKAWFLKQGFYPDVVGELEIVSQEIHFFLMVLATDTLFAGLVLRKSRLHPREMERVGFCCGNAVKAESIYDYSPLYEKNFEVLLAVLGGMSKTTITVL